MPIITVPFPIGCTSPPSTWQRPQSSSVPPSQMGNSSAANIGCEPVDRLHDHGLRLPGRLGHRVDRHPVEDPARGVPLEQEVRQRRQQHDARIGHLPRQPRILCTSARVIPPIKNSATTAGSADPTHSWPASRRDPHLRSLRMCPHTHSRASGWPAPRPAASRPRTPPPRGRASPRRTCHARPWPAPPTARHRTAAPPRSIGVSRVCSSPGRCTITRRSLPTSECTPNGISITSFLHGRMRYVAARPCGSRKRRRWTAPRPGRSATAGRRGWWS